MVTWGWMWGGMTAKEYVGIVYHNLNILCLDRGSSYRLYIYQNVMIGHFNGINLTSNCHKNNNHMKDGKYVEV